MSDLETRVRRYAEQAVDQVRPVTASQVVAIAEQRRRRTTRLYAVAGLAAIVLVAVVVRIALPGGDQTPVFVDSAPPLPGAVLETWGAPVQVHVDGDAAWVAVGPQYTDDGYQPGAPAGIVRIDTTTLEVEPWVEVAALETFAVGHGSIWAVVPTTPEILRIDQATGQLQARIEVPEVTPRPGAERSPETYVPGVVLAGPHDVWFVAVSGYVAHIDPETGRLEVVVDDHFPDGPAAVDGRDLWFVHRADPEGTAVSRVTAAGEIGPTFAHTYEGAPVHAWDITVAHGRVWSAAERYIPPDLNQPHGLILAHDPATGEVLLNTTGPGRMSRVQALGGDIFGADDGGTIVRVEGVGDAELEAVPVGDLALGFLGGWPSSIIGTDRLWFVRPSFGDVVVVDPGVPEVVVVPIETASTSADVAPDAATGTRFPIPEAWGASPEYLEDGTPVFVVTDPDGEVRVFDAVSPHLWEGGAGKLVAWCVPSGWFEEMYHGSAFAPNGGWMFGPSASDLSSYDTRVVDGMVEITGPATMAARGSAGPDTDPRGPHCWMDEPGFDRERLVTHEPADLVEVEEAASSPRWRWTRVRAVEGEDGVTALCSPTGGCDDAPTVTAHRPRDLGDVAAVLVRLGPDDRVEVRWPGYPLEDPSGGVAETEASGRFAIPEAGDAAATYLSNGTPVFVVSDPDGVGWVVGAITPHRWNDMGRLLIWCRTSGQFESLSFGSAFGPDGAYADGPADSDLDVYPTRTVGGEIEVTGPPTAAPRGSTGSRPRPNGPQCILDHPDFRDEDTVAHPPVDAVGLRRAATSRDWRWTEVSVVSEDEGRMRLCPPRWFCTGEPIVVEAEPPPWADEIRHVILRIGPHGRLEMLLAAGI